MQASGTKEETEPKGKHVFKFELKLNFEEGDKGTYHWNWKER